MIIARAIKFDPSVVEPRIQLARSVSHRHPPGRSDGGDQGNRRQLKSAELLQI